MDLQGDLQGLTKRQGIRNAHWYKILGADGHQTATDPEYNDIVYGEFQQGVLHRVDLKTGGSSSYSTPT